MDSFTPEDRPTGTDSESARDAEPSFADVATGPALCEMLDAVEFTELAGGDVVEAMAAAYRQHCRQQAVFYRAVLESGLRVPFSTETVERLDQPGEFASEELRARLAWSRTRAESTFVLAYTLFVELPDLGAAMLAGDLDLPRAQAFIRWTEGLSDEHISQVIGHLVPTAGEVTVGELIDEIKRACLAADPDWAEKKYAAAVRTRHVRGFRNPDGTGNLAGFAQPVDRVIAATRRIDALARRCKRSGDRRGIDLIRSDLFLRMLDGSFEAMSDAEIVEHVLANPLIEPSDPYPDGDPDDGPAAGPRGGPDDEGGGPWPGDGPGDPYDHGGPGDSGPGERAIDGSPEVPSGPPVEPASRDSESGGTGPTRESAAAEPAPSPDDVAAGDVAPSQSPRAPSRAAWAVPELRIQLTTAIGLDDHPGHVPGWDYLTADLARRLVDEMHDAQWRWVVCDSDGRAVATGITRRRPTMSASTSSPVAPRSSTSVPGTSGSLAGTVRDPRRGGIVELAIRATDLSGISSESTTPERWRQVIADIAAQYSAAMGSDQPRHGGSRRAEPGRLPSAGLRRWLQVRDRRCSHPRCRVPASRSDIDHRKRWVDDGPTSEINLGPACRHDHRIKDEGDWSVEQLPDGTTVWRSPLGQRLISQPPAVIPRTLTPVQRPAGSAPRRFFTYAPPPCTCIMQPCPHSGRRDAAPGSKTESGKTESGKTESGKTESGNSQDGEPEHGEPEHGEPEDGEPEDGEPEDGEAEDGEPEDGEAEDGEAEVEDLDIPPWDR